MQDVILQRVPMCRYLTNWEVWWTSLQPSLTLLALPNQKTDTWMALASPQCL